MRDDGANKSESYVGAKTNTTHLWTNIEVVEGEGGAKIT